MTKVIPKCKGCKHLSLKLGRRFERNTARRNEIIAHASDSAAEYLHVSHCAPPDLIIVRTRGDFRRVPRRNRLTSQKPSYGRLTRTQPAARIHKGRMPAQL